MADASAPAPAAAEPVAAAATTAPAAEPRNALEFHVRTNKGADKTLGELAGPDAKAILVVNVASKCGFTKQYTELQELYEKYKGRGLAVVGFPCNQFGSQEPGTDAEIQEFACSRFKVSFPLTSKVDVNGDDAHPLYKWLKHEKRGIFGTEGIKWNFTKFLVDRSGEPVHRYSPTTTPSSIEKDILPLLE